MALEIIGAIASVGAIVKGTAKTFGIVRSIPGIEDDWRQLNNEIDGVEELVKVVQIQFPTDEQGQPHQRPIHRAFNSLKETLSSLERLAARVTRERKHVKHGEDNTKANKAKWLYLRNEINDVRNRLRDGKMELSIALTIAMYSANRRNGSVVTQAFQAMTTEFGTMTAQLGTNNTVLKQMKRFIEDEPKSANSSLDDDAEDVRGPDSCEPPLRDPGTASGTMMLNKPSVTCPRPCYCRCHHPRVFSWARCDYDKCQRNVASRKATWRLNLAKWLIGYSFTISISTSLRTKVIILGADIRAHIVELGKVDVELARRYFLGTHPLDEFDFGGTVLDASDDSFLCYSKNTMKRNSTDN